MTDNIQFRWLKRISKAIFQPRLFVVLTGLITAQLLWAAPAYADGIGNCELNEMWFVHIECYNWRSPWPIAVGFGAWVLTIPGWLLSHVKKTHRGYNRDRGRSRVVKAGPGWRRSNEALGRVNNNAGREEARKTADRIRIAEPVWRLVIAAITGALTYGSLKVMAAGLTMTSLTAVSPWILLTSAIAAGLSYKFPDVLAPVIKWFNRL